MLWKLNGGLFFLALLFRTTLTNSIPCVTLWILMYWVIFLQLEWIPTWPGPPNVFKREFARVILASRETGATAEQRREGQSRAEQVQVTKFEYWVDAAFKNNQQLHLEKNCSHTRQISSTKMYQLVFRLSPHEHSWTGHILCSDRPAT